MSVQAHGVCGDEFVLDLLVCVFVFVCVFVRMCLRIEAWHGDENRTMTVSQVGSVSKFDILLISSPKRQQRGDELKSCKRNLYN